MGTAAVRRKVRFLLLLATSLAVSIAVTAGDGSAAPPGSALPAEIRLVGERVHVGRDVQLTAAGQHVKQTHFDWQFERRPRGSKARFQKRNTQDTAFQPDVPGAYMVRLTIRLGPSSHTTTLRLGATEAGPLVPVNTLDVDDGGNPGMTVGGQFYADPGNGTGIHVVVLDRNTLELVEIGGSPLNYSVPVNAAAISTGLDFRGLPDSSLVMVALPASAPAVAAADVGTLNAQLATIGAVLPGRWLLDQEMTLCWASNLPYCYSSPWKAGAATPQGSFSVIGVPGMAPGAAWYDDAAQRGKPSGPLAGYLTRGVVPGGGVNQDAYTFVFGADQYVLVDTCVGGGLACPMQVGAQSFAPAAGVNGYHVVVLDRVTLKPLVHQTVGSTQALYSALTTPGGSAGHFVGPTNYGTPHGGFSDRVVVLIQGVGTRVLTYDWAGPLLQAIDWFGGTPETIGGAIIDSKPYALVGVATDLPWHGRGIESSPVISSGQTGRSRGVLARDRRARYTPSANDPTGSATLDLATIVYQDPTPWPYADTAAGACAIQYIATGLGIGAYPDIRSAYHQTENIIWTSKDPTSVSYPTASPPCSPFPSQADYQAIQARLKSEFAWVMETQNFISNLQKPFDETQGSTLVDVTAIGQQIYASVKPPAQTQTVAEWLTIFNQVAPVVAAVGGGLLPEAAPILGAIATSGKIASETILSPGTSPFGSGAAANLVVANAIDLATRLSDQILAHLTALVRLEAILVADAGKLQAVGTNLENNPAWQWSPGATSDVVNALNASTRQTVYSALLPAAWPLYSLKPDLVTQFSSAEVTQFACGWSAPEGQQGIGVPFKPAVAANQFTSLVQLVPTHETSTTEIWTFGFLWESFSESTNCCNTIPTTSLVGSLFSLGSDGGAAYAPAWYRSTFNPPYHAMCGTNNYQSVQKPPAVIAPQSAAYDGG
jgi:hypothetical protein